MFTLWDTLFVFVALYINFDRFFIKTLHILYKCCLSHRPCRSGSLKLHTK